MDRFRTLLIAVAVVPLLTLGACASHHGSLAVTKAPRDLHATLMDREREWADAMSAHDFERLNDILAEEFRLSFVDFPGALPREGWLANLRGMTFGPIDMKHSTITMHGENVATVRMRMTLQDWRFGDDLFPPDYDLTDIWVLRDGRWQVINRISEPLDPSGPAPGPD